MCCSYRNVKVEHAQAFEHSKIVYLLSSIFHYFFLYNSKSFDKGMKIHSIPLQFEDFNRIFLNYRGASKIPEIARKFYDILWNSGNLNFFEKNLDSFDIKKGIFALELEQSGIFEVLGNSHRYYGVSICLYSISALSFMWPSMWHFCCGYCKLIPIEFPLYFFYRQAKQAAAATIFSLYILMVGNDIMFNNLLWKYHQHRHLLILRH